MGDEGNDSIVLEAWTPSIAAHAILATAALVLGTFNAFRTVRGDGIHKTVGRIWIATMVGVSIGSFWIGDYTNARDLFLHGLAVWTIVSVSIGILAARRGAIGIHRLFMLGTYAGLLGALAGVLAVPDRRIPSWFSEHPVSMTAVTATVVILAAGAILAVAVASDRRRGPRDPQNG